MRKIAESIAYKSEAGRYPFLLLPPTKWNAFTDTLDDWALVCLEYHLDKLRGEYLFLGIELGLSDVWYLPIAKRNRIRLVLAQYLSGAIKFNKILSSIGKMNRLAGSLDKVMTEAAKVRNSSAYISSLSFSDMSRKTKATP